MISCILLAGKLLKLSGFTTSNNSPVSTTLTVKPEALIPLVLPSLTVKPKVIVLVLVGITSQVVFVLRSSGKLRNELLLGIKDLNRGPSTDVDSGGAVANSWSNCSHE